MNKTTKIISAFFLLLIAGVIVFYQFRLSTVKGNKTVSVVVSKVNIFKGDEITADMVIEKKIDVGSVVKGNASNPQNVVGKIATENFRINEQIIDEKITTKELSAAKDMRLVSILNNPDKDTFTAYELRPLDNVDIYYIPPVSGSQIPNQTIGTFIEIDKPFLENVEIFDTKSAEGMSYRDKQPGQVFTPKYALLLQPKEIADQINKKKAEGGYFMFSIHGLRPTIDSSKKSKVADPNASIIFK